MQISNGEDDIKFLFNIFLLDWFQKHKIIANGNKNVQPFPYQTSWKYKKNHTSFEKDGNRCFDIRWHWHCDILASLTTLEYLVTHVLFQLHQSCSPNLLHHSASKARSDPMLLSPASIWRPLIMLQAIYLTHDL